MKVNWDVVPFEDAVADVSGGNLKTLQKDYLQAGAFPVVDQGAALVAGYIDDPAKVCKADLPVIVFGDHTRCFKYVDFPFAMGADGVKVLRPRVGVDPKYLYHYLRQLRLTNAGYSRHFKYLKRHGVLAPPIDEQRRIAELLDRAEALRAKRRAAIEQLESLKQSIFLDMFGDPIANEKGLLVRSLLEVVAEDRPITYGILQPGPHQEDGVPYVRVVDMKHGGVDGSYIRRTTAAIADSYKRSSLRTGDLLLSIRGHVGRLGVVPADLDGANITQDAARLAVRDVSTVYVMECLRTVFFQRWMSKRTKGVAVRGINLADVKQMPIPIPSALEQEVFERKMTLLDGLASKSRVSAAALDSAFGSLRHRAFAGES